MCEIVKLCNETITLFTAKLNPGTGTEDYYPTVIRGVSWYCEIASSVDSSGLRTANKFIIRIPEDADFSGKTYVDPVTYANGSSETAFTLKSGDILVKGVVGENDLRPADLRRKYSEVVTVLGVTDNRKGQHARHWKVVGT